MFLELKDSLTKKISQYELLTAKNLPVPKSNFSSCQVKLRISKWQKRYLQLLFTESLALSRVEILIKDIPSIQTKVFTHELEEQVLLVQKEITDDLKLRLDEAMIWAEKVPKIWESLTLQDLKTVVKEG
jgi:hypothetical protein